MSTAHRPTWAPAQARDVGSGSRVLSVRDVSSHTKLKFRQPGQGGSADAATSNKSRRDLKAELAKAERAAERKRKGITAPESDDEEQDNSKTTTPVAGSAAIGDEDEQAAKRRKLIEEAVELDRDDDSEEEAEEGEESEKHNGTNGKTDLKGKGKAVAASNQDDDDEDDDGSDDSSDEEEDDEDETAELLRELEKIKRERAEEKERQERERAASDAISAEEQAALGNPLLNLQAALSGSKTLNSPGGYSSSGASNASSSFAVKKRWDDDVIFKNQAVKSDEPKKEFVNDLIRTQFHRRFLQRYIA